MTIKELRTKEGLSQAAMAKRLGVATSAIGHMENGRMKVSPKIAAKVKDEFGVDVDIAKVEKPAKVKTEKPVKAKAEKVKKEVKTAAKKVEDKAVAEKIEAKKTAAKATRKAKTAVKETTAKVEKAIKKVPAKAKTVEKKAEDKAVADKIEAKKTAAKTTRKAKTAVEKTTTKVEKKVKKPAAKAKAAKLTIEIQSPLGGSITPEEIAAKLPKDTTNVYVRIDENKLYWVKKNGENGSVDIWE